MGESSSKFSITLGSTPLLYTIFFWFYFILLPKYMGNKANPTIANAIKIVSNPNLPRLICAMTGFFLNYFRYYFIFCSVSLNIYACFSAGFYKLLSNPSDCKCLLISVSKNFFVWSVGAVALGRRYLYISYDNGICWILLSSLLTILRRSSNDFCNYYSTILFLNCDWMSFYFLDIASK